MRRLGLQMRLEMSHAFLLTKLFTRTICQKSRRAMLRPKKSLTLKDLVREFVKSGDLDFDTFAETVFTAKVCLM